MNKIEHTSTFPVVKQRRLGDLYCADTGMTLRDWFAGQALAGMLAQSGGTAMQSPAADGATYAYRVADAMLAVRNSHKPIDIEYMLAVCVPGGSSCDPQAVADSIREYWAKKGGAA